MPHDVTPDGLHLLTGGWGALGVEEIGATVVSWRPGCRERLYTASDALVGAGRMDGLPRRDRRRDRRSSASFPHFFRSHVS